jgi:hypothetical protein
VLQANDVQAPWRSTRSENGDQPLLGTTILSSSTLCAMASIFRRLKDALGNVIGTTCEMLDRRFPSESREEIRMKLHVFAQNNPTLAVCHSP